MPIYEYECTCCPSRFELKRRFDEDAPVSCPQCGGSARRIFSPVPIIFKGSGFYVTDNRGNHGRPLSEGNADKDTVGRSDKASSSDRAGNEDKAGSAEKTSSAEKAS